MLYDCWRQVARRQANQVALIELARGRRWTFAELDAGAAHRDGNNSAVRFVSGASVDFILDVLHSWRLKQVICPLEVGQSEPLVPGALPRSTVHLKTTSASTGPRRLVAFTAAQLMADADNIVSTMGLRPEWPNIGIIS